MLFVPMNKMLLWTGVVNAKWSIRVSASELESIHNLSTSKMLKHIHRIGGSSKDQCTMPLLK
jgi:hypothetical protein